MEREDTPSTITERSRVPLSIVASAVVATGLVVGMFFRIDARLSRIEQNNAATWSLQSQKEWIWTARDMNREKHPDVIWPDAKPSDR